MANESSWYPMKYYDKSAASGIMFGPCLQDEVSSYMYPNERIPKGTTVIWATKQHKTVSINSYYRAHVESDIEALGKISALGIPLGCTFGGLLDFKKGQEEFKMREALRDPLSWKKERK